MYSRGTEFNRHERKNSNRKIKPLMQNYPSATEELLPATHEELNLAILEKMEAVALENLKNFNFVAALQTYQRCLDHYFESVDRNPDHPDFAEYFTKILKILNDHALKLLKEERVEIAKLILEKCEEFTNGERYGLFPVPRNITLNHLACCYRRMGMLDVAMEFLQMALEFVSANERTETAGITHINISAVLSQMNNHVLALEHAKKAVFECSFEIINSDEQQLKSSPEYSKKVTMLAIAYHNLGVEEDMCGNVGNAKDAYFKAYEMLERHIGPDDALAKKFKAAFLEAKNRFANEGFKRVISPSSTRSNVKISLKVKRPLSSNTRSTGFLKRSPQSNDSGGLYEQKMTSPASRVYFADNRIMFSNKQNTPMFSQSQRIITPKESYYGQHKPGFKTKTETSSQVSSTNTIRRPQTANPKAKMPPQREPDSTPFSTQNNLRTNVFFDENPERKSTSTEYINGDNEEEIQEIEDLLAGESDTQEKEFNREVKSNRIAFLQNLQNFNDSRKHTNTQQSDKPLFSSLQKQEQNETNKERHLKISKKPESITKEATENGHSLGLGNQAKLSEPQNVQSPNKRSQRAATHIQKHIRGKLVRIKYAKFLKEICFWLLVSAVNKLSLYPDDPFDTYNFQILAWYDLQREMMIFQIKKIFNKRQVYTAKVKHALPSGNEAKALKALKNLAASMIPLMYLESDTLKFKPRDEDKKIKKPAQEVIESPKEELKEELSSSNQDEIADIPEENHDTREDEGEKQDIREEKETSPKNEEKPPANQLSEKMISRIQALIRGKLSRAKFVFLGKGMYQARDSLSFRHKSNTINIRILQKYPPRSRKLSAKPKEFLIYARDWTKCFEFNFVTVPATHFIGKELKVENLLEFLEINIETRKLKYTSPDEQMAKSMFGFDEKTLRLILKVQKVMRGHLWRKKYNFFDKQYYRVLFSRSFLLEKHIINVRILERIYKRDPPQPLERLITAQDFTDKVRFGSLNYDYAVVGDSDPSKLTVQDIMKLIEFNIKRHEMNFKLEKKEAPLEKKDASLEKKEIPIEMTTSQIIVIKKEKNKEFQPEQHTEETYEELKKEPNGEATKEPEKNKRELTGKEDEAARRIQRFFRKKCTNLLFLTKVPVRFSSGEEFEASIFYSLKTDQIWVDFRSPHFDLLNLRLSIHDLGLEKFPKGEFLDGIDFYLLGYLSFKENHVVFEREGVHVASTTKDDDPISLSTKKGDAHKAFTFDYEVERIDTDFAYEKEFEDIEEVTDQVLKEVGSGLRTRMKTSLSGLSPARKKEEDKKETESPVKDDVDDDPAEIRAWRASFRKSLPQDGVILESEKLRNGILDLITSEPVVEKTSNVLHIKATIKENEKEDAPDEDFRLELDEMYERAVMKAEEEVKKRQSEAKPKVFDQHPKDTVQEKLPVKETQENKQNETSKQEAHKGEASHHENAENYETPKKTSKAEVPLNRNTQEREGSILKQIQELEAKDDEDKKKEDIKPKLEIKEEHSAAPKHKVEKAYQHNDLVDQHPVPNTVTANMKDKPKVEKKKELEQLKEEANEEEGTTEKKPRKKKKTSTSVSKKSSNSESLETSGVLQKKKKPKKKTETDSHPEEGQKTDGPEATTPKETLKTLKTNHSEGVGEKSPRNLESSNADNSQSSAPKKKKKTKKKEIESQPEEEHKGETGQATEKKEQLKAQTEGIEGNSSKLSDNSKSSTLKKKKKKVKETASENQTEEKLKIEEEGKKPETEITKHDELKKNEPQKTHQVINLEDSDDKSMRSPPKTDRLESSGLEHSQMSLPAKKKKTKKKREGESAERKKDTGDEPKEPSNDNGEVIPKKKTTKKKVKQSDGQSESLNVSKDSEKVKGSEGQVESGKEEEVKEKKSKKVKSTFSKKTPEDAPNTQPGGQGSEPQEQAKDIQQVEVGKEEQKKKKKKKKPAQEGESAVSSDQKPQQTSESPINKVGSPKDSVPKLMVNFRQVEADLTPSRMNRGSPAAGNSKPDKTPNFTTEFEGIKQSEEIPKEN